MNEFDFINGGARISNVFFTGEDLDLNLPGELNIKNFFYSNNGKSLAPKKMSKEFNSGSELKTREMWHGFGVEILLKKK